MGFEYKFGRYCDECGRSMAKAHRIYKGAEYCSSCYARVFIQVPCLECDGSVRVHKNSVEKSICNQCVRRARTCYRCGKPVPKAGMISENGNPICPSCSYHFSEERRCPSCGELSKRLSSAPRYGVHEKICDRCRTRLSHKTCSRCRKYRVIKACDLDRKPLCQSCLPDLECSHPCPGCGVVLPGNGRSRCVACLNWARLRSEVELHKNVLEHDWAADLFDAFSRWLYADRRHEPALLTKFKKHEEVFEALDQTFRSVSEITPSSLLESFSVQYLRNHMLATEFLQAFLGFEISMESKVEVAEQGRIEKKLADSLTQPWGALLKEYYDSLRGAQLSARTIRLYLRAAEKFCDFIRLEDGPFTNQDLLKFLKRYGGSRASLHRFVTFARDRKAWNVAMPETTSLAKQRRQVMSSVSELSALMDSIRDQGVEGVRRETLMGAMALAFDIPSNRLNGQFCQLVDTRGGIRLQYDGELLIVPEELQPVVEKLFSR